MSEGEPIPGINIKDGFAKMASEYDEAFPHFTEFAGYSIDAAPKLTSDSVVHDNACGTGAVSAAIIARFKESGEALPKIVATDMNPAMIAEAKKKHPELDAKVMDATSLDLPAGTFSHSFTNFLLNPIFPSSTNLAFTSGVRKTLAPGGTAVFAVWYYLEWLVILRDAANAVRPDGEKFVPTNEYPQETIRATLTEAGFSTDGISFTSREGVCGPFTPGPSREQMYTASSMIGGIVTATWSEDEKKLWPVKLTERFDKAVDDTESYKMKAWIVTAKA
jgi:SAM-dependent methyltransferase